MFSLNYLLGLLSVFTVDIRNISWAYNAVVRFFSGSDIPLWLFPAFSQPGCQPCCRSSAPSAIPLSIYIGKLGPDETAGAVALQIFWLAALVIAGTVGVAA